MIYASTVELLSALEVHWIEELTMLILIELLTVLPLYLKYINLPPPSLPEDFKT